MFDVNLLERFNELSHIHMNFAHFCFKNYVSIWYNSFHAIEKKESHTYYILLLHMYIRMFLERDRNERWLI